tara:strand:+ start:330 stop:1262 length:933 start_codon:yes stop_codon:yes gene_type:complete
MEVGDICKQQLIPPKTDLKKMSIVTDFPKNLGNKSYPQPKPHHNFELFYGKNNRNQIKELGRGGNGVIFLVTWDRSSRSERGDSIDDKIVLKYPLTEPEYEPERVMKVLKGYHHHIIPYKVVHDQHDNPFVIMQQANGDIFDLLRLDLTPSFRNKMIAYYAKAIGQLWRKRIVFTDMKPENLLYQCHTPESSGVGESGGLALYFGDIGAFANEGEEEYDYEVEPPECDGVIDKNFCLFTLGLMAIGMYDLKYERPKGEGTFIKNFYNPVKEQILRKFRNRNIQKIVLQLLSPYREYRDKLTVNEAVEWLT